MVVAHSGMTPNHSFFIYTGHVQGVWVRPRALTCLAVPPQRHGKREPAPPPRLALPERNPLTFSLSLRRPEETVDLIARHCRVEG